VTSDTCHGSTISSADCLWKLNHAQKVGQLCRSSDAGLRWLIDLSTIQLPCPVRRNVRSKGTGDTNPCISDKF